MAKTLILAEKDEATYLSSVGAYLKDGLPESYKLFALGFREEGYSASYTANMVKVVQWQLRSKIAAKLKE